jgi:putative Mg2+ transporter-C (MgtC) family protein
MSDLEFLARLSIAIVAGGLVGFERQWHHKAAGLRTNTLVATGSAIFTLLSLDMTSAHGGDATRVVGQIVTGIGFLGAGIIIHQGTSVHGLTTAATVWCSAAIGCIAAAGHYSASLMATGAVLAVNMLLLPLDRWLTARKNARDAP